MNFKLFVLFFLLSHSAQASKAVSCLTVAEVSCEDCAAQLYVICENSKSHYEGHIANTTKAETLDLLISNVTTNEEFHLTLKNPPDELSNYRSSVITENGWIVKQLKKDKIKLSDHIAVDLIGFTIKGPIILFQDAWMTTPF